MMCLASNCKKNQHQRNTIHQLWLSEHQESFIHTGAASVGLDHGPPVEWDSLILDVVLEIGLCKDVDTTVSDFLLFDQPES